MQGPWGWVCAENRPVRTQGEGGRLQVKGRGLRRNQTGRHLDLGHWTSRAVGKYSSGVQTCSYSGPENLTRSRYNRLPLTSFLRTLSCGFSHQLHGVSSTAQDHGVFSGECLPQCLAQNRPAELIPAVAQPWSQRASKPEGSF